MFMTQESFVKRCIEIIMSEGSWFGNLKTWKLVKAESNAAVTSKANAGNFAAFAMKYGGNVETGMARLFLPGKELIHLSNLSRFQP